MTSAKSSSGKTILRAFFVSSFGTFLSRILGMVRDVVIAHFFGASKASDAFWIAWTIPSVFRRFVADEGLTGAMIPAISQEESAKGTPAARQLTDIIFTILMIALVIFCLLGIFGAPFLAYIFAYGFSRDPEMFNLIISLTRWLFPFVAMVSFVSFCEGIVNYRNHFFLPKIAPGLVSLGMFCSVILFYHYLKPPIYSLVIGVLAGGLLHALLQLFPLKKYWYWPRLRFAFANPRIRVFLKEMGKVIGIGIFAQLNVVLLRLLASFLTPGSVTHYWNANRIIDLTNGMIVIGMASAIMPALAKSVAQNDWLKVRDQLEYSLKAIAFFLFPALLFIAFFNQPIVSLIYRHGNFTFADTQITAATLQLLIPFLFNIAIINILKKVYFALDDRNPLLWVGGGGVLLTAAIGAFFITRIGVKGLSIALSVSTFVQLMLYILLLKKKIRDLIQYSDIFISWARIILACVPFAIFLYFINNLGSWEIGITSITNLFIFIGAIVFSLITFLVMAYIIKIPELQLMVNLVRKRKKNN